MTPEEELDKLVSKSESIFNKNEATISISHEATFGKCVQCDNFSFAEGEFSVVFAKCNFFDRELTQKNKIVNCSKFKDKSLPELWEMKEMAVLIDIDHKTVGFCSED